MRSGQAVVIFELVLGPGLAGPNQWQSVAAWCNACLPALAVDKPSLSSKRIICSCLHNVNTYGSSAWSKVVAQLHAKHCQTCGNMLQPIQMLIALHRSERWAFAEWIGMELDSAFDKTVKS